MHVKRLRLSSFETRSLALFASLALSSGVAVAQFTVGPGPAKPGMTAAPSKAVIPANSRTAKQLADAFRQTDTDGNGSISRQEARLSGLSGDFNKADTNRDGVLSRAEFDQSFQ